jgi:hypothetical protein
MPPVLRLYFRSVAAIALSCYFPARSINMDRFFPADGRDISAGKRLAATLRASGRGRARRESEEQIPRQLEPRFCRDDRHDEPQHAIAAAIRRQGSQVDARQGSQGHANRAPSVHGKWSLGDRARSGDQASLGDQSRSRANPQFRVSRGATHQIYSTHVSSKFHANPLKTNNRCLHKPQQKTQPVHADIFCATGGSISAGCRAEGRGATFNSSPRRGATLRPMAPNYSTHVPSNFRANSLKTNKSGTREVTHFSRVEFRGNESQPYPERSRRATNHQSLITNHAVPSLLSSAEALRIIFRCMIVVLYKRNFFEPGEPRWALLFLGPKTIHISQSSKAFRREND